MAPYVPGTEVGESNVSNGVYITGFNSSILGGNATIFTSDFNGDGLVTGTNANHLWTYNVVAKWDYSKGAYVVTDSFQGMGSGNTKDVQLSGNMIMIAVHDDGGTSTSNKAILSQAQVGQVLNIYGLDVESRKLGIAPYVTVTDRVDAPIYYQTNGDDLRLIAYVNDYTQYSKVTFTMDFGAGESRELVCRTAYSGLYANGKVYTTKDIYGVDGYFVAFVITEYIGEYGGEEVTFTARYTTVDGNTVVEDRTLIIE